MRFKPKHQPVAAAEAAQPEDDSATRGVSASRVKELLAQVEAEQAAAAKVEPLPQDAHQWRGVGKRRITQAEAEAIKRKMIGPWRRHFTLAERTEFLQDYEVIVDHEPLPIPTSPTHHAEILAARVVAAAPKPKPKNRFVAAARVLLTGANEDASSAEAKAEPVKLPKATFFS